LYDKTETEDFKQIYIQEAKYQRFR